MNWYYNEADLSDFTELLPLEKDTCIPVDSSILSKLENMFPDNLIELWKTHGWAGYGNGFLWTVNPLEQADITSIWGLDPKNYFMLARTGLGNCFYWNGSELFCLLVHYGRLMPIAESIGALFISSLCDKRYLDEGLNKPMFEKVLKKLGRPNRDEMYTFTPALALGGTGKESTLQKVTFREQMAFLADLNKL